ncbi:MAG: hypothetical protein EPN85_04120 [Bacteroidetes bacterium]|nr:MAG: hypothetical protein EPN85_04120 [Bacteroidota bacterium]
MQSKIVTPRFLFVTVAILIAAISRVLPHPPNFTPIAAIALFGGAYISDKRLAFLLPLLIMFISDSLLELVSGIGFHNTLLYVYASFVVVTLIGIYIRNNAKSGNIILASLISSILFFIVTNFGVWAASGFELGFGGLIVTYAAGIPFYNNSISGSFFLNTIVGDLFYCGILFGSLYFAKSKFPRLA